MSLRTRRNRERRQRTLRALGHTLLWLLILAGLAGAALYAYQVGSDLARAEVVRLQQERDGIRAEADTLRAAVDQEQQAAEAARTEAAALRRRYEAEVPTGRLAQLLAATRARLEAGLPEDRLLQVVQEAAPRRACDGPPIVRRFRITPGERAAPEDGTSFFEGLVRVQAAAPAGFETLARTMVVTFSGQGLPEPVVVTGVPAAQSFRIGHHEATVTVTTSPIPGFAAAAVPTCRPD